MPDCPPHNVIYVCKKCGVSPKYAAQSPHCDHVWGAECSACSEKP